MNRPPALPAQPALLQTDPARAGAGFYCGSLDSNARIAADYAGLCGAVCCSVGYRLCPESPFPAGVDDCWAALMWATHPAQASAAPLHPVASVLPIAIWATSSRGHAAAAGQLHCRGSHTRKLSCRHLCTAGSSHAHCCCTIWAACVWRAAAGLPPRSQHAGPSGALRLAALRYISPLRAGLLNVERTQVAVAGESAGGNLAAVMAIKAKQEGLRVIQAQVCCQLHAGSWLALHALPGRAVLPAQPCKGLARVPAQHRGAPAPGIAGLRAKGLR